MDKLNLMSSFIAVAEEGTYTAAAKRLGKTKALISTHVSQLEGLLDVRLITRSTRSMQLTPTGQSYYEEAKKVLDDIATLEAQVRQEHQTLVGRLRISAPATFGELVMMPFIAQITSQNPQLNVELMLNDRYVDIVAEGFDAAIRIGHLEDSTLIARPVGNITMRLCAAPEFIKQHGMPASPDDLCNLPCVFDTNYRQANRWGFTHAGRALDVKPKIIARVNSALAAANMAKTGAAITYAPDFAVQDSLANGRLISLLEECCLTEIPINMIYPHRKHLSAKVTAFIEQFSAYVQQRNIEESH